MMNKKINTERLSWVPASFYCIIAYCFGASIMDSFVVYPGWKLLQGAEFVNFHQQQSVWIIKALVIPLAFATLLNILMLWAKPDFIGRKWIWISLCCMLANWVMSFLIQIPIHHHLNEYYDAEMLKRLLRTNYIRVFLQAVQILVVYKILIQHLAHSLTKCS